MDEVTTKLIELVNDKGAAHVSSLLGHNTTLRVQRWVKSKEIPQTQVGTVATILKVKKAKQ